MKSDDHQHQKNFNNYFRTLTLRLTVDLFRLYSGPHVFICRYFGGRVGKADLVKITLQPQGFIETSTDFWGWGVWNVKLF
jgi:hypothetical protein